MSEFKIKPSVSLLMIWRNMVQRRADFAAEERNDILQRQMRKLVQELDHEIRMQLRGMGFERDCEIDMDMNVLTVAAREAIDRLDCYLLDNSPAFAQLMARSGDRSYLEWQEANPSPIRPQGPGR